MGSAHEVVKTLKVRWHWWLGCVVGWNTHFVDYKKFETDFSQFRIYKIGMYPDKIKYNSLSYSKYVQHDAEIPLTIHAVSYSFGGNHHGGTGGQRTGVNGIRKSKWPENVAPMTPYTFISKVSVVTPMVNTVPSEGEDSLVYTVSSIT